MGDLGSVLGLVIALAALAVLILSATKYKQNRGLKLALYVLLTVSAGFRMIRGFMQGVEPSWLDALAIVFFGYAAVAEAVPLIRKLRKQ